MPMKRKAAIIDDDGGSGKQVMPEIPPTTGGVAKKCTVSPASDPVHTLQFHVMDMRSKVVLQQFQKNICKGHTTPAIWDHLVKIHKTYPNGGAVKGGVKMFAEMNNLTMLKSGIMPEGSTVDEIRDLLDEIMEPENMLVDDPQYPLSLQDVDFLVSMIPELKNRRW